MERKRERKRKQILLRSDLHQTLGQILAYLESLPFAPGDLIRQTLEARFLPLCINKNNPQSQQIARECLGRLEGYAAAIRELYGLNSSVGQISIATLSNGKRLSEVSKSESSESIDEMFGGF